MEQKRIEYLLTYKHDKIFIKHTNMIRSHELKNKSH